MAFRRLSLYFILKVGLSVILLYRPVQAQIQPGGYNGGGLFNLELFNTTGCELPPLPLPDDVLELLEAIATGELLRNPLEGLVNSALGAIGDVVDSVVDAIPSPELPGRPGEDVLSSLQSVTDSAQQITNEFNDHCARLSGVSNYREGFELRRWCG